MKKISITDFEFKVTGYGHYNVTYTSPVTGKQWTTGIDDMSKDMEPVNVLLL